MVLVKDLIKLTVRYLCREVKEEEDWWGDFNGELHWAGAAYNAGIANGHWLRHAFGLVQAWFAFGETLRCATPIEGIVQRL